MIVGFMTPAVLFINHVNLCPWSIGQSVLSLSWIALNLSQEIQHVQFNIHNKHSNCFIVIFHPPKTGIFVWTYCKIDYLYMFSELFLIFFCITSVFVLLLFMVSEHFDAESFEQMPCWRACRVISLTLWKFIRWI